MRSKLPVKIISIFSFFFLFFPSLTVVGANDTDKAPKKNVTPAKKAKKKMMQAEMIASDALEANQRMMREEAAEKYNDSPAGRAEQYATVKAQAEKLSGEAKDQEAYAVSRGSTESKINAKMDHHYAEEAHRHAAKLAKSLGKDSEAQEHLNKAGDHFVSRMPPDVGLD